MHLWRPEEIGITLAGELVQPLRDGLALMESAPDRFSKFNAPNGWGSYDNLLVWIREYLEACEKNPDASITVSR